MSMMAKPSREWHPQVPAPTRGDRTLYTYEEAARVLRKSARWVRNAVYSGRIPAHLVTDMGHKQTRFTGDQLVQIIDLFAAGPPPAPVQRRRGRAA